jgi:hypothetical protein
MHKLTLLIFFSLVLSSCNTSNKVSVVEKAENLVRDNINDALSAKFKDVKEYSGTGNVCGKVNAKDGNGAYIGWKRFAVIIHLNKVSIEPLNNTDELYNIMWEAICS